MPYKQLLMILVLVLSPFLAMAQPPEIDDDEAALLDPFAHPPSGLPQEESGPEIVEGDTIIFKSGSELKGINIIRESALFVEVEYLPGEPPVKFPTSQIAEVILNERSGSGNAAGEGLSYPEIVPGEEVSIELHQALMTVLSEDELPLTDQDYLTVIRDFVGQTSAELEINDAVNAIPEGERIFSRTLPAGITLLDFLQKEVPEIASDVRVVLQFDKVLLTVPQAELGEAVQVEADADDALEAAGE
ncbi:MAG: hypothetical protein GX130_13735 [Candidatus Hydrogenedens sp.]|jgi:hypothetical protein|nr:hypothetical protein [Candidatus Hydrogenedens sp.]